MATALRHFSECVDICDAHGLTRIAVPNRVLMGVCRFYVCDIDGGLEDIRKALETARRIGDRHAEMLAMSTMAFNLTAALHYDAIGDILAMALEEARALKARRYEAYILGNSGELALVEGRREEALSLVRQGLAASDETSPKFVGPYLFGLLALLEQDREAQEAAMAAGKSLLAKGAFGHNHFSFRRYAIEQALLTQQWDAAERHADALLARMRRRAAALFEHRRPARPAPRASRTGSRDRRRRKRTRTPALESRRSRLPDRCPGRRAAPRVVSVSCRAG